MTEAARLSRYGPVYQTTLREITEESVSIFVVIYFCPFEHIMKFS
jgi:hypothetical protein